MSALDVALLRWLRVSDEHRLLSEFAASSNVSLRSVEDAIAGLGAAGFHFENKPGFGCRLLNSPDRIIADDLHARLSGESTMAREILVFEETASTNDVAMRLGREGHPGNVVIFAESQTAGRGRFLRHWESATHQGLWMSVLIRPQLPLKCWPRLTTATGVAMVRAFGGMIDEHFQIKWPNDVLHRGKKVAGTLIESAHDNSGQMFAVVGIGVNCNQLEFPPELQDRATSLRIISRRSVERAALATHLLHLLEVHFDQVAQSFDGIVNAATNHSVLLGNWITLQQGSEQLRGEAHALDPEGNLILRLADGQLRTVHAGEVTTQLL